MKNETELQHEVDEAVRTLREGGLLLYPTDTVWGIGCDATNADAVARIYALKRSENKKSMLVLCASPDMVVRYVNKAPGIAFEVMELATSPLTLILPGATGLAANLIPEEGTLGEVAREIIDGVDFVVNPRFEGKPTRKASSIIAFTEGGEVKIIRE